MNLVGLIPAAGVGARLGGSGSKEVLPVADPAGETDRHQPAICWLLDTMGAAGIESAYVVLRRGKWDVLETAAERGERPPRLGCVVVEATASIPETLDRARPLVRGRDLLLAFPDVLFQPAGAVGKLLAERGRTRDDIVLGLFPSTRPDKTDMVEVENGRVTGFRIKPGPCELEYTWLLAAWGDRFTEFLGSYLDRTGGGPPAGSSLSELQISQVLEAALAEGLTIGACAFPDGRFVDIGTPEDLRRAQRGGDRACG